MWHDLAQRAATDWPAVAAIAWIPALWWWAEHHATKPRHTARVRGYVRRAGARWEYGLRAATGQHRRLGVRRTHAAAGQAIERVMHPGEET